MGERMKRNRKFLALLACLFVLLLVGLAQLTSAQQQAQPKATANAAPKGTPASGAVARGKYLVEDVAYCTNCHTPRNSKGELLRSKWLQGGPLFWQPAHPLQNFPQMAPRIAGTPPATDDQMITLLTTGIWTDGSHLREPMPQFRFTRDDAQAVIAYLKTLNSTQE